MIVPVHSPARVLIADDFAVVREGVKALLQRQADLRVTAEAVDGPTRSTRPSPPRWASRSWTSPCRG